ncbi:Component of a membrane-bound complex containing the Tor2p kinase [Cryptotrichosporon argae]
MALIADVNYALQAIRLSTLRATDDPLTPRIITLDPAFALDPYITASGLSDIDRWPEIKRALDSPPPMHAGLLGDAGADEDGAGSSRRHGLRYTQTIMGGRSGAMGMRVTGRRDRGGRRDHVDVDDGPARFPTRGQAGRPAPDPGDLFSPPTSNAKSNAKANATATGRRPRADSAPAPALVPPNQGGLLASSMISSGHGLGFTSSALGGGLGLDGAGAAMGASMSELSVDADDVTEADVPPSSTGISSARPGELGLGAALGRGDGAGAMGLGDGAVEDEGSDVDPEEALEGLGPAARRHALERRRVSAAPDDDRRSSTDTAAESSPLVFARVAPAPAGSASGSGGARSLGPNSGRSALTALLNQHVPHLVSTSAGAPPPPPGATTAANPFAAIYASVAAPPTVPAMSLELYFPHAVEPGRPVVVKVRKDATVEEVTGHGLWKYWDEGREPRLSADEGEERLTSAGWALRIVEDDGEVDEDFPALDRESQISKFSYGQFAIVAATAAQIKANAAKAPTIPRRPSRIIADVSSRLPGPSQPRPPAPALLPSSELLSLASAQGVGGAKAGTGFASGGSRQVLLRVRVSASADVHFTTTISVPADMYIADLTEVLVKKKRLPNAPAEWVLCLADLSRALPLDRTVASLEGKTDLALVRRQWATEHGLHTGDRTGGDPSASIFARQNEPAPAKFGPAMADFAGTYRKYTVLRRTAIGRHERVLAIDGDYIHIMPSENRALFDSMKTTSIHVTLVAACKLSGRAGGFKLIVWRRDSGQDKRYEFEAENGRVAAEIVGHIKELMKVYQSERVAGPPPPKMSASRR